MSLKHNLLTVAIVAAMLIVPLAPMFADLALRNGFDADDLYSDDELENYIPIWSAEDLVHLSELTAGGYGSYNAKLMCDIDFGTNDFNGGINLNIKFVYEAIDSKSGTLTIILTADSGQVYGSARIEQSLPTSSSSSGSTYTAVFNNLQIGPELTAAISGYVDVGGTEEKFAYRSSLKFSGGSLIEPAGSTSFSSNGNFTPIGTADSPFKGIFEGANHTIKGMTVLDSGFGIIGGPEAAEAYAGVFGVVDTSGIIRNLNVLGDGKGGSFTAFPGGKMDGFAGSIAAILKGQMINCHAYAVEVSAGNDGSGTLMIGGLVGQAISNSVKEGLIKDSSANRTDNGKGLIGAGNISADGKIIIGGIVGESSGSIINCRNTLSINGTPSHTIYAGGIVGSLTAVQPYRDVPTSL